MQYMTYNKDVIDEVESDNRIDDLNVQNEEIYLTVYDPKVRNLVQSYYKKNYNVDVATRGLNIKIEW